MHALTQSTQHNGDQPHQNLVRLFVSSDRKAFLMVLPLIKSSVAFPEVNTRLESFGFKLSVGGTHTSRTMMLEEITRLLGTTGPTATIEEYRRATVHDNALGKETETTREKTFRHLRELYGLSEKVPLFGIYRELMRFDPQSAPLLSLLVAWTRDPLLRATTPVILTAGVNVEVAREALQRVLRETFPGQYSPLNIAKIARNAASSWTQSGHLTGHTKKIRCRVEPGPAAVTLGFVLGYVSGWRGEQLFSSPWCQLLDLTRDQVRSLAFQAHREELLTMKAIGSVVEVSFPRFSRFLGSFL